MKENAPSFEQRKRDHLDLATKDRNQATEMNVFDAIRLPHEAIPDGDLSDVDLSSTFLGQPIRAPFFISSMTAGHRDAPKFNRLFMEACAQSFWAMGVGSQRRELYDPVAVDEWKALRAEFPTVRLMSNLGLAQLIHAPLDALERLVDNIEAVALIVHCNPLQECIQPEGTPQFKGAWKALAQAVSRLSVPLVVKETGCGFSESTLIRLRDVGIAALDVSGLGGTHWGRIEGDRAAEHSLAQETAQLFKNWGMTTLESLSVAKNLSLPYEIWASGGVRHGLDAAKALVMGAQAVGFAKVMLEAALQGSEAIYERMQAIEHALRVAMFCTGSFNLEAFREKSCL